MKRVVSSLTALYMCIALLISAVPSASAYAAEDIIADIGADNGTADGGTGTGNSSNSISKNSSNSISKNSNITPATDYEEIPTVTAAVYYGDFVWGQWVFDWNEELVKTLAGGKLQSGNTAAPLTTSQAYTHGDLIMIGLEQEVTFKKIELKSAVAGQIPYKFKLEYSISALPSSPEIPNPVTTIGEYTGYSVTGDTLTVELAEPVTARSLWLQALTNGADQEPGASEWSVSEIHLYKENFNTVPQIPVTLTAMHSEEHSLTFSWSALNNNYTGFDVYRSASGNGPFERIGTTTALQYTDNGLEQDVTYYYKVKAINLIGESEFSELLPMKTKLALTGLSIAETETGITLAWPQADGARGYQIYRSTGKYSEFSQYASTDLASFSDPTGSDKYHYYYKVRFIKANGTLSDLSDDMSLDGQLFGNTMTIFSPTDDPAVINRITAETAVKMKPMATAEFSDDRYAFMFKPGTYGIHPIDVGYYTSIYGLGATPLETIVPKIQVSASEYNSLTNFWRSVENIGIDAGGPGNEVMWAASQAAPARRLYVNGKLQFDDQQKYASGGFLADSFVTGQTGSYSQQQYFLRNNVFTGGWYGGVWNMLFVGVDHAPAETADWDKASYASYTVEQKTPVIREKPFLYFNQNTGTYSVFVPGLRTQQTGVSWSEGNPGTGTPIPIADFYVAKASSDTADTLNAALNKGKHLLLTPGIYRLDQPLHINHENTVVLGLGLATLIPTNGNDAVQIADVGGVTVAGILMDAGEAGSNHLLQAGPEGSTLDHSGNPTLLADVYARIGGAARGKADVSIEINSSDVIGDHFWLWRADHGMAADSTGWTKNTAKNGLIVNGDDVTVYGLFVEHFQEYQTLWNGENGRTFFYQSEIPYDPPYQADYMSQEGTVKGYASYKVSDQVKTHYAVALGIYDVFVKNVEWVELENAIEVPDGTTVKHAATVSLGANGGINHIINGTGEGVKSGQAQKKGIKLYYTERAPETTEPPATPVPSSTPAPENSPGSGSSSDNPSSSPASPPAPLPAQPKPSIKIMVGGKAITAGTSVTETINGQQVTTVSLDEQALFKLLETERDGLMISIPVTEGSGIAAAELSTALIEQLEGKQAALELRTRNAWITLPAQQLDLSSIMNRSGNTAQMPDTRIRLEIDALSSERMQLVQNAVQSSPLELSAPPVAFRIFAKLGKQTVEIPQFKPYVKQAIRLPDDLAPERIYTGIAIEPDGSIRPVPTRFITVNADRYAVMSSLSTSTYTVVASPAVITDIADHWSKASLNNMAARLIITGAGGSYFPDQSITRAEFTAMLVRALGLKLPASTGLFSDVKSSDWYGASVQAAFGQGLIMGFADGTFRPDQQLKREQAVLMINKAAILTGLQQNSSTVNAAELLKAFSDRKEIAGWARDSFAGSLQAGIVTGRSLDLLAPKETITRAEAAVLIERLLQRSEWIDG